MGARSATWPTPSSRPSRSAPTRRSYIAQRAAIDPEGLLGATEEQETKDRLRRNTDEVIRRGVFGAPTFFVGGEMFWGNDRLDWVEEALRRAEKEGRR